MKRSRLVSHGDDQLIEAEKRQNLSDTLSDTSNLVSQNKSRAGIKSYDGRLSLLSLVCNQQLSNCKNDKPQGHHAVKMPHKIPVSYNKRNKANAAFAKSAERILGIMAPVVISPSDDESTDQHNHLAADIEVSKLSSKLPSKQVEKKATTGTFQTGDNHEKEKQPFVWKDICRPVPLPPRLPMVPAGYIFSACQVSKQHEMC